MPISILSIPSLSVAALSGIGCNGLSSYTIVWIESYIAAVCVFSHRCTKITCCVAACFLLCFPCERAHISLRSLYSERGGTITICV